MVTAGATLMVIFYDKYFLLLSRQIQSLLNGNKDIRGWAPWCLLLRFLYVPFHCQVLKSVCGYSGRDLGVCEGAEALWQILCVGLSPAATFCRGVIWWKLILRFWICSEYFGKPVLGYLWCWPGACLAAQRAGLAEGWVAELCICVFVVGLLQASCCHWACPFMRGLMRICSSGNRHICKMSQV